MVRTTKEIDANELADEIERRGIKFSDLPLGQYEMPSAEEVAIIVAALRRK